jgi:hypothetical protein
LDLMLQATPGLYYRIEGSTNLALWTSVTSFMSTNAVTRFLDPTAVGYQKRFYRAVLP